VRLSVAGRTTREEKLQRIGLLERAISEVGWSMQLKRRLAAEFGCSTRTIDQYRCDLVAGYQTELEGHELETQRAEFLVRLRGHQRAALSAGRLGSLAGMMNIESRILGLDKAAAEPGPSSVEVILRVPEILDNESDS